VWLTGIVLGFITLAVWWLQREFGASMAIVAVGAVLGVVCLIVGWLLSLATQRTTLQAAGQFNADLAGTEKARQAAYREGARLEREVYTHQSRMVEMDARRVDQIAQQRAKLLTDVERQRMELQYRAQQTQQADAWRGPEGDAGAGHLEEW
jgi:Zn-dependent protease with chaperone function